MAWILPYQLVAQLPSAATRPSTRAGQFGRRIIIEQASAVTDADTPTDEDTDAGITWTTFCNAWASIQPTSVVGGQTQGEVAWLVQMRYQPGVLSGMRVNEPATGILLDILAVLNVREAGRELNLDCISRKYPPV